MADRYAYLPFLGLFIMLCWGLGEWAGLRHLSPRWLGAPAVVMLLWFSTLAYIQISYWRDNVTLWSHALQVTSNNFVAEDNLGGALVDSGRVEEAIAHFRIAAEINPQDPLSRLDIGVYDQLHGNLQPAIGEYEAVLRLTSDRGLRESAYDGLGSIHRRLGNLAMAKTNYETALALNVNDVRALIGLALVAETSANFSQAVTFLAKAVAVQPNDVDYLLLSRALQASGRTSEAQTAYQQAQRLSENFGQTQREADRLLAP
jgi:tetratricopeptide (TPR) repeat protein